MRALNRNDARDLLVLLLTLAVMTNVLMWLAQLLIKFPLSITDGWLISCVLLLLWKRFGPLHRFRRRRAARTTTS